MKNIAVNRICTNTSNTFYHRGHREKHHSAARISFLRKLSLRKSAFLGVKQSPYHPGDCFAALAVTDSQETPCCLFYYE